MFVKKITVFAAVIILSLSVPFVALADTGSKSLSELDDEMAASIQQIIDDEIDEDIKEDETKILEAIKAEVSSAGEDLSNSARGSNLIKKVAKDNELHATQWTSAFQEACEQYGVRDGFNDEDEESSDADADKNAVSKLHILQWDEDSSGVNRSAMKIMIDRILTNTALANIMGICMAFASAMCIAFGLGDIIQQATEKSASTESLWRGFLKMCIGLFIIYNCLYIAAFLVYVGSMILTVALNATTPESYANTDAYRAHMAMWASVMGIEKSGGFSFLSKTAASGNGNAFASGLKSAFAFLGSGIGGVLGAVVDAFGNSIGNGIIQFIMSLSVYAVAINTGVRFVFTPLAVADLFSERFRSTGMRWLKSLAAAALQGVIIYVIYIVGTELTEILEGGAALKGFSPVTSLVVYATMIGLFAKSGAISKEIVGTH